MGDNYGGYFVWRLVRACWGIVKHLDDLPFTIWITYKTISTKNYENTYPVDWYDAKFNNYSAHNIGDSTGVNFIWIFHPSFIVKIGDKQFPIGYTEVGTPDNFRKSLKTNSDGQKVLDSIKIYK